MSQLFCPFTIEDVDRAAAEVELAKAQLLKLDSRIKSLTKDHRGALRRTRWWSSVRDLRQFFERRSEWKPAVVILGPTGSAAVGIILGIGFGFPPWAVICLGLTGLLGTTWFVAQALFYPPREEIENRLEANSTRALECECERSQLSPTKSSLETKLENATRYYLDIKSEYDKWHSLESESDGIVYILINDSMPGLVKIGRTGRSVSERIRELNTTGVATPFYCYYAASVRDMCEVESRLHNFFAKQRVNEGREFFRVEAEIVRQTLAQYAVRDATHS